MILEALTGVVAARKTTGLSLGADSTAEMFGGTPTAAGVEMDEDRALSISAVFCAVEIISNAIGGLPLFVFARGPDGSKRPDRDHPAYRLLHTAPNPETTPKRFKKQMTAWMLLWGNSYAEIELNAHRRPKGLWPIHPGRVRVMRDGAGEIVYEVHNQNGTTTTLAAERMLHVMGFSKDGMVGISRIGMARESLGLTVRAEEYGARFFGNGARPAVILEMDSEPSAEVKEKLKQTWQEGFSGENVHKTALLPGGVKAKILGMPNEDAQFLETRVMQVQEVARWFTIPTPKLQEHSRSTFNNAEHLGEDFKADTILPIVTDFEEECDRKLVDQDTHFCEYQMDALLRADAKARQESLQIKRTSGIINANEWRRLDNLDPIGGPVGEAYFIQGAMVPVDRALDPPETGTTVVRPQEDEDADAMATGRPAAAVRRGIVDAHTPWLAEAFERMRKKEANAMRRALKTPDTFGAWAEKFYAEHALTVRAAIIPPLEALAGAIRATLPDTVLDAEWDRAVAERTKRITEDHVLMQHSFADMNRETRGAGAVCVNASVGAVVEGFADAMSEIARRAT